MRIKLDQETTQKLIQALQEGLSVGILVDGFEEKLDPKDFPSSFSKFIEGGFQNFLQGPL